MIDVLGLDVGASSLERRSSTKARKGPLEQVSCALRLKYRFYNDVCVCQ